VYAQRAQRLSLTLYSYLCWSNPELFLDLSVFVRKNDIVFRVPCVCVGLHHSGNVS